MIGPILAVPAPQPVIDALHSVQVTTSAGQADGFQLTFAVSNKSLINLVLLPSGYFDPGTRVILIVILAGLPSRAHGRHHHPPGRGARATPRDRRR